MEVLEVIYQMKFVFVFYYYPGGHAAQREESQHCCVGISDVCSDDILLCEMPWMCQTA